MRKDAFSSKSIYVGELGNSLADIGRRNVMVSHLLRSKY